MNTFSCKIFILLEFCATSLHDWCQYFQRTWQSQLEKLKCQDVVPHPIGITTSTALVQQPKNSHTFAPTNTAQHSTITVPAPSNIVREGIISRRRGGCIGSWWGNWREGDHWGDLGVDGGGIILERISRRWDVCIWTGLGWPRIETGGGRL